MRENSMRAARNSLGAIRALALHVLKTRSGSLIVSDGSQLDSREDALKHAVLAMLAACLVALSGGHARADYTVVEVNFILADKHGDLLLSKTEYLLVPLEAFARLDANGNNALDADELGDLPKDAEFVDGDSDKNGNLSLQEIISEKLADFEAVDTNKDGALNVDEVTVFDTSKSEGA